MIAEIYTRLSPVCGYCVRAKALLEDHGVEYKEYIVSNGFDEDELLPHQQYTSKAALLERAPEAKSYPQIWLNGSYIGGYTELFCFFQKKAA